MVVNDFLIENFDQIMDYNFTASVEAEFDDIAEGKKVWNEMIDKFYQPFHLKLKMQFKIQNVQKENEFWELIQKQENRFQ